METVFDCFTSTNYTFLLIGSTIRGETILDSEEYEGVLKSRNGMEQGDRELRTSAATLHVKPSDFPNPEKLVGNGILHDGVFYGIVGCTVGTNFDTGEVEHYRLTLQIKKYVNEDEYK